MPHGNHVQPWHMNHNTECIGSLDEETIYIQETHLKFSAG